jgi:hypothetical protein
MSGTRSSASSTSIRRHTHQEMHELGAVAHPMQQLMGREELENIIDDVLILIEEDTSGAGRGDKDGKIVTTPFPTHQ